MHVAHEKTIPGFHRLLLPGLGFLLLLAPWLFFLHQLGDLSRQEDETLDAEARQLLLTEQEDFFRDLDPGKFLERLHNRLDLADGMLNPQGGQVLSFPRGEDPNLISRDFVDRRWEAVRREIGTEPLFLAAADCDFRKIWWRAEPSFLASVGSASLDLLAMALLLEQNLTLVPWLPTTVWDGSPRNFFAIRAGFGTFRELRERISRDLFGEYWTSTIKDGVYQGFTHRLGGQRMFACSRALLSASRKRMSYFGGYSLLLLDRSLPGSVLLEKALADAEIGPGRPERLLVRDSATHRPERSGERVHAIRGTLPPTITANTGSEKIRAYEIRFQRPQDDNLFTRVWFRVFWAGLLLISIYVLMARSWIRRDERSTLAVRWKLVGTVGIAIVLPLAALGLMFLSFLQDLVREFPERILTHVRNRAKLFAASLREVHERTHLQMLEMKPKLANLVESPAPDFSQRLRKIESDLKTADFGCIMRVDGRFAWVRKEQKGALKEFYLALAQRLLSGLNPKFHSKSDARDLVRGDAIDDIWKFHQADISLALEGMESKYLFGTGENQRMLFFALSKASGSDPAGVALFRLFSEKPITHHLNRIVQTPLFPAFESLPLADVRYAVFSISILSERQQAWPPDADTDPRLSDFLDENARTRVAGVVRRKSGDELHLQVWERVGDAFFMVVASVKLRVPELMLEFGLPCLLLLFVYGCILSLLMSDILTSLFLDPIRVLSQGITRLAGGGWSTRVRIDSADEFAEVGAGFNHMAEALQQRERLRRFLPGRLVSNVTESSGSVSRLRSEHLQVIVLASDIRGFTALSEKVPPEQLVESLNEYFTLMEQAIAAEGGMIFKLIGDAILAVFYADASGQVPIDAALRAAFAMRRQLAAFNEARVAAGLFPIENGVGLAAGPALSAELGGSGRRRDFTIVGRPVREATFLESLSASGCSSRIVVCQAIAAHLAESRRLLPIRLEQDGDVSGWEVEGL